MLFAGIAGAIVLGLASVWAMKDGLATLRAGLNYWTISKQQDLVAAGKAPPDSVAAVAAALDKAVTNPEASGAGGNPFTAAGGLLANAGWLVVGIGLLLIGPKLVDAFTGRKG